MSIDQYDDELRRLYEEGWSMSRLAEHFPISLSSVKRRLDFMGVEIRPRGFSRKQLDHAEYERTIAIYNEDGGRSYTEVAGIMGLPETTVLSRLMRAGAMRDRSESQKASWQRGRRPHGADVNRRIAHQRFPFGFPRRVGASRERKWKGYECSSS